MVLLIRGNVQPAFTRVDYIPDGSAAEPGITFATDNDTGIFHPEQNAFSVSCGATERLRIDTTGTTVYGSITGNIDASNLTSGVVPSARLQGEYTFSNVIATDTVTTETLEANVVSANTLAVTGIDSHLVPNANVTYDVGSETNRWRDLYLSGSTIQLGNATISEASGNVVMSGAIQAVSFVGDASGLTNVPGANISGSIPSVNLPVSSTSAPGIVELSTAVDSTSTSTAATSSTIKALEDSKVNRAGDTITGNLLLQGKIDVTKSSPQDYRFDTTNDSTYPYLSIYSGGYNTYVPCGIRLSCGYSDNNRFNAMLIRAEAQGSDNTLTFSTWTRVNSLPEYREILKLEPSGDMKITGQGYKPGGGSWAATSDIRIKHNIEDANVDLCYDIVKALPLQRFEYTPEFLANTNVTDTRVVGWIADEVELVFPKAVTVMENEMFGVSNIKMLDVDQLYKTLWGATTKIIDVTESHAVVLQEHTNNIQTNVTLFAALETTVQDQANLITSLETTVQDQANLITSLETTVQNQANVITDIVARLDALESA